MARRVLPLRRLRQDCRGVSVIELALCMPLLGVVLLGLIDISSCYSARMSIQQAAARSLERVQVSGSTTNFAYVRTEAATAAGVPVSQVTVTTWMECNNVRQTATTTSCGGTQVAGRYVQVTINSSYTPNFPYSPLGPRQANGNVALTATAAVRYG